MHFVYPTKIYITIVSNYISPGYYSPPKRNRRRRLCKILGGEQGALWSVWKWRMEKNSRPEKNAYSYFEKGCREKCTRQSRKVLWVDLSLLFFKGIWKNDTIGHGHMFASAKGKQQKEVRQLQCQEQYIDHIPYYLSGLSRAHIFLQPFSK